MFDPEYTISMYLNGDEALTQGDVDQLADWIEQSPENAAKFVQASFIHRAVHDSFAGADIEKNVMGALSATSAMDAIDYLESKRQEAEQEDIDNLRRMHLNGNNLFTGFLKIAAVVMISLSAIWFMHSIGVNEPEPSFENYVSVATLDVVSGVSWDKESEVLQTGDRLFVNQDIVFSTGSVRIRFDNSADVLVQAPVSFRIKGEKLLYLQEGKLTAVVPPGAKGFTVLTPVAEVVDFGTEFGVTVDKSGRTETSVFEGAVDFSATDAQGHYKPKRITEGLSRTIDQDSNLSGEKAVDETLYTRMGFSVNVNFQPPQVEVPRGFLKDVGSVFHDRDNGYSYGWDKDRRQKKSNPNVGYTRFRKNHIQYDDRRYSTLIRMQIQNKSSAIWEIEVPDGTYEVGLVMGDPMFTDSTNNVLIEGVAVNDPDGNDNFDTYSDVTVVVSDGRLTVEPGLDAYNIKLCFIRIVQK